MTARTIVWQRTDLPGTEWCALFVGEDAASVEGTVVLAADGAPWRIEYLITLDGAGRTRHLEIHGDGVTEGDGGPRRVDLFLEADGAGRWTRDGDVVIDDPKALDCDLGFSPATNTLPIRRLGLAIGERRDIAVAWVLFPSFEVVLGRQSYERLTEWTWRYRSTGFEADLTVDKDGLVQDYYEWHAIGRG